MEQIGFSTLRNNQCAFIDVSSLLSLISYADYLDKKIESDLELMLLKKKFKTGSPFKHALNVVERMVAYEFVVFDKLAAGTFQGKLPCTELIKQTTVPKSVYLEAGKVLSDDEYQEFSNWLETKDDWYDGDYEAYFDQIAKDCPGVSEFAITENMSAARVLFYMELSVQGGVPIFFASCEG